MGSGTGLLAVQYTTVHADVIEQTILLMLCKMIYDRIFDGKDEKEKC